MKLRKVILFIFLVTCVLSGRGEKPLNSHLQNRPMADMRPWHLGFSVGMQFQDLRFAHNGDVLYDGTRWFVDQPSASPGFCVNGLVDFRLSHFFNIRLNPGLYFGSKTIKFIEEQSQTQHTQTLKSTYLVLPFDLKFSAVRYRNSRPYVAGGLMPAFDLSAKKGDFIQLKSADLYLTVALGCDFYLPYFKLIPEIKFCFGLADVLRHDRPDLDEDPQTLRYTQAIRRATSSMVVLTFYFE